MRGRGGPGCGREAAGRRHGGAAERCGPGAAPPCASALNWPGGGTGRGERGERGCGRWDGGGELAWRCRASSGLRAAGEVPRPLSHGPAQGAPRALRSDFCPFPLSVDVRRWRMSVRLSSEKERTSRCRPKPGALRHPAAAGLPPAVCAAERPRRLQPRGAGAERPRSAALSIDRA